jgi:hypothetical protein
MRCARCGKPTEGDDLCEECLDSMVYVAVEIPRDFDPDPDACERYEADVFTLKNKKTNEFVRCQFYYGPFEVVLGAGDTPWVASSDAIAENARIKSHPGYGDYEKPEHDQDFNPEDWEVVALQEIV